MALTVTSEMHILIVTGVFPPDIGGPATYVPQIAPALIDRGHRVTVLTLADRLDDEGRGASFSVVRLPRHLFKPWRWLRTIIQVLRLGQQADVLLVNGLFLEAVLANLWLRKPMVQKVVGDLAWEQASNRHWVQDGFQDFQNRRYDFKVGTLKALRAWWTSRADWIIVPSHYLAHCIARWGIPEEKIQVIYNAVQTLSVSPSLGPGKSQISSALRGEGAACGGERSATFDSLHPAYIPLSSPVKVVTVGRLVCWKRVDKLMQAVARCDNTGLVIVGDGPERAQLEKLAQVLGVADRVYIAGQRCKAETLALMAACDLFVLNSTYEGLPHVVLEAMSLGLPVVATAVGGTPELVQDGKNGRLIAPQDDHALYDVLAELLSSPFERQRLAAGARQSLAPCSFDTMVEATATVLNAAAHRASRR